MVRKSNNSPNVDNERDREFHANNSNTLKHVDSNILSNNDTFETLQLMLLWCIYYNNKSNVSFLNDIIIIVNKWFL